MWSRAPYYVPQARSASLISSRLYMVVANAHENKELDKEATAIAMNHAIAACGKGDRWVVLASLQACDRDMNDGFNVVDVGLLGLWRWVQEVLNQQCRQQALEILAAAVAYITAAAQGSVEKQQLKPDWRFLMFFNCLMHPSSVNLKRLLDVCRSLCPGCRKACFNSDCCRRLPCSSSQTFAKAAVQNLH